MHRPFVIVMLHSGKMGKKSLTKCPLCCGNLRVGTHLCRLVYDRNKNHFNPLKVQVSVGLWNLPPIGPSQEVHVFLLHFSPLDLTFFSSSKHKRWVKHLVKSRFMLQKRLKFSPSLWKARDIPESWNRERKRQKQCRLKLFRTVIHIF